MQPLKFQFAQIMVDWSRWQAIFKQTVRYCTEVSYDQKQSQRGGEGAAPQLNLTTVSMLIAGIQWLTLLPFLDFSNFIAKK